MVISEIVTLSVYWNWEYWKNQITIVSYSIVEKAKISKDKTFTGIRTKKQNGETWNLFMCTVQFRDTNDNHRNSLMDNRDKIGDYDINVPQL